MFGDAVAGGEAQHVDRGRREGLSAPETLLHVELGDAFTSTYHTTILAQYYYYHYYR